MQLCISLPWKLWKLTKRAVFDVCNGVVISHCIAFQKAYYYYKDVSCSQMQAVEQELERLLPGKQIRETACLIVIILIVIIAN